MKNEKENEFREPGATFLALVRAQLTSMSLVSKGAALTSLEKDYEVNDIQSCDIEKAMIELKRQLNSDFSNGFDGQEHNKNDARKYGFEIYTMKGEPKGLMIYTALNSIKFGWGRVKYGIILYRVGADEFLFPKDYG
jgi:hypothetical protein